MNDVEAAKTMVCLDKAGRTTAQIVRELWCRWGYRVTARAVAARLARS